MTPAVVRHADAPAFLERAGSWLLEREAENNLILGVADSLVQGDHDYGTPVYLVTVEEDGEVIGCAWRTPPHKLGVTRMPAAAIPALVADVAEVYEEIGAVLGDEEVAGAFARGWAALRGLDVRPGMRQRIYEATAVRPPDDPPPGAARPVGPADFERALEWFRAFRAEAGVGEGVDVEPLVRRKVDGGALWFWEDGRPVSLAGVGARSPHGARIGPVYTPPEDRRKGYATALVADLSRRQLRGGLSVCFLYTDLSNPTSNSIYTRIGYRPVADVRDFAFGPRPDPGGAGSG